MIGAGIDSSIVATEILCNQVILGRDMHDIKDQATLLMRKSLQSQGTVDVKAVNQLVPSMVTEQQESQYGRVD